MKKQRGKSVESRGLKGAKNADWQRAAPIPQAN